MATISIIVPVYNVENYLRQCLDSIVGQIYTDWECILVDDGSTDNSGGICDEYSNKDSRIVVLHKKNEGVSVARNTGLSIAKGKYLAFFDSDDMIASDMLHDLVTIAEERNSDIVQSAGPIRKDGKNGSGLITTTMTKDEVLNENFKFSNKFKPSLWLGIYNRSLFNDVQFPRDIHHYEDFVVLSQLAYKSNGVTFTDKRYYYYRQREGSAVHSMMNEKKWSAIKIPTYLKSKGVYSNREEERNTWSFFIIFCLIEVIRLDRQNVDYTCRIKRLIWNHFVGILISKAPSYKLRLMALTYIFFPNIVTRYYRLHFYDGK